MNNKNVEMVKAFDSFCRVIGMPEWQIEHLQEVKRFLEAKKERMDCNCAALDTGAPKPMIRRDNLFVGG